MPKLNKECYKAVENYLNPNNRAYYKHVYYRWIEDNFGKKQTEACIKEVKKVQRIEKHAKGVEKGIYNTYDARLEKTSRIGSNPLPSYKKPPPPPSPPLRPIISNYPTLEQTNYDKLINILIEQEKKR